MKNILRLVILAAAMLTVGFALRQPVLAQHDHRGGGGMSMPAAPTVRSGTLGSRDESSIKIETKQRGAATYMVDARTKYKGDIQTGTAITVKYEEQGGMRMGHCC